MSFRLNGYRLRMSALFLQYKVYREVSHILLQRKKQSAVNISVGSSCVVRVFIHASVHCAMVIVFLRHQVSFVLACPSRGTHVTTWYHHLWSTCSHMTHCTWDVVVVQTPGIYSKWICLILSSINTGTTTTRMMFFINWITCQAYVIRTTALDRIMRSSDITCRIEKKSFKTRWCAFMEMYPYWRVFDWTLLKIAVVVTVHRKILDRMHNFNATFIGQCSSTIWAGLFPPSDIDYSNFSRFTLYSFRTWRTSWSTFTWEKRKKIVFTKNLNISLLIPTLLLSTVTQLKI